MPTEPTATTVLPPFTLANHHLLALMEKTPFNQEISAKQMAEVVYLAYQPWQSRQPDHVFRALWQLLCDEYQAKAGHWVLPMLQAIAHGFLHGLHSQLFAKLDTYGEWQTALCRISGLPVQAVAYACHEDKNGFGRLQQKSNRGLYQLMYPYDAVVEDYIEREGLHETHLHLNGSTYAEHCWQRALSNPIAELKDFSKSYSKSPFVSDLCHSINPDLNPVTLFRHLRLAKSLRNWLIAKADQSDENAVTLDVMSVNQLLNNTDWPVSGDNRFTDVENQALDAEMHWMVKLLERLHNKPSALIDRLFHFYLLLQNEYLQLTVQREDMYGFDQFQKFTLTDLRSPAEKQYLYRYRQMTGSHRLQSRAHWVEGRFAPKDNCKDNITVLKSILGGYLHYLRDRQQLTMSGKNNDLSDILEQLDHELANIKLANRGYLKLTLVSHFIKTQWQINDKRQSYRHESLRKSLKTKVDALCETLIRFPKLKQWLCGIDAASNELHTSPEVFSPYFRVCRRQGFDHKTYHVGEEFTHLISGLRHVADALTFLDLKDGNRIGHGTALGIDPHLWLNTMPKFLVVHQGEWLLDLLGAWRYLRNSTTSNSLVCQNLASDICRLANIIFAMPLTCEAVDRLMSNRDLLPEFVFACVDQPDWFWQSATLKDAWREEARLVDNAKKEGIDLELLAHWWRDPGLLARSEKLIEVKANYLDEQTLILLQQCALRDVQQRRVVIETLPTSNVRISQYQHHRQHHALRWMRVDGFVKENDPEIMVSMGSDDPGIFCNDLSTDFYHLYAVLREHGLNDDSALNYLAKMNERGRQYRFHDKALYA